MLPFVFASKGRLGNPINATPCCIWSVFKPMKSLMKLFIREGMSVHLQFDINDNSQPFHQRCSELATEGRPGILTKLLLKAVGHSLAAEVGDIPNLVFDIFCSLKIDRM